MRKSIICTIALAIMLGLSACNDKLICPAFQSYYVFDDDQREQMFSLFGEDSLPKMDGDVVKNQNGLVKQPRLFPYQRKKQELNTVPMETVMPGYNTTETTSDSVGQETNFIAQEVFGNDDDAWKNLTPREYAASAGKRKIGINIDQKNYEALFGDYLAEQFGEEEPGEGGEEDPFGDSGFGDFEEPKEKRGFFGFFKDLFGGKKRRQQQADEEGFGDDGIEDNGVENPDLNDTFDEDPADDGEPQRKRKKEKKPKKEKREKPPKEKREKPPKEKKEKPPKVKKEKKPKEPKEEKPPKEKKKKKEDDDSDGF